MFCQSRKGIARDYLVFFILAIVGFIIIVFIINIFMGHAKDEVNEEVCRASILSRAKAVFKIKWHGATLESTPLFPVVCKTRENIELTGDRNAVMEQISYMSARCWWMFLNGEYENLFDEFDFLSNKKCFTCYIFTVKSKLEKPITPDDIIIYMNDHYYIGDEEKGGITYLDYIQSYKGNGVIMMRDGDKEEDKLKITGGGYDIYTINFMSPDITWWTKITTGIFSHMQFWKSGIEKEGKTTGMTMSKIYIEELGKQEELDKCKVLESI
ncbi:MAG: hypothetical protein KKA61_00915 [Nanoarchaeota archaeon]|nr:hypothetical protein [Nanoarchaeota archaeon]MBU4284230.1 hypothetical protein [Nanoarchaeota archaeon]MBU4492910.1 hypothetical protein [Nanoarchaeota archaeon]